MWQQLLSRLHLRGKTSSHPSEDTPATEHRNRTRRAATVETPSPSSGTRRGARATGTPASRAAGIFERGESTDEIPDEPQGSPAQCSVARLTVAMLAFTAGGAAGFGFRWIAEPSPPAVREFAQGKRNVEMMTGQVKSLKSALAQAHRAQSVAEKALADAEISLVELKTKQAADAAERSRAGASRGYGVSRKPVRSMPCDLTGSSEAMAQGLKDCVKAFENLNR